VLLPTLPARHPRHRDEISSRLHYTAEDFHGIAHLGAIPFSITAFATLFGFLPLREFIAEHPVQVLFNVIVWVGTTVGWWWTGELLHARRRTGAWLALATLVPPCLERVVGRGDGSSMTLVISVLGCAAVLSSWRELD
jgi:hypothetical protein